MKIVDWVKKNKLSAVLLLVIVALAVILLSRQSAIPDGSFYFSSDYGVAQKSLVPIEEAVPVSVGRADNEATLTAAGSSERLVTVSSDLSLVVDEVEEKTAAIIARAEELGGFMVSRSVSQPEESPYAYLTLRIPAEKLAEADNYFKSLAVKVVSESVNASDITDQYEDIEEKLALLEENKSRFETIMAQAVSVEDILSVQREILTLQAQIDSLRGRKKYLDQSVQLSLVSVYLSTDELALPYHPTDTFRPQVIFKQAVRSVVSTLRSLASGLIWLATYGVFWLPIVAGIIVFKHLRKKRK